MLRIALTIALVALAYSVWAAGIEEGTTPPPPPARNPLTVDECKNMVELINPLAEVVAKDNYTEVEAMMVSGAACKMSQYLLSRSEYVIYAIGQLQCDSPLYAKAAYDEWVERDITLLRSCGLNSAAEKLVRGQFNSLWKTSNRGNEIIFEEADVQPAIDGANESCEIEKTLDRGVGTTPGVQFSKVVGGGFKVLVGGVLVAVNAAKPDEVHLPEELSFVGGIVDALACFSTKSGAKMASDGREQLKGVFFGD